jgi:hypothetical protein
MEGPIMDDERFDSLVRALSRPASRRGALGALLGTALGGVFAGAAAKPAHHRDRQKTPRHAGTGDVQAQASCANPGPGQHLDGCDFSGQDFAGRSLRGAFLRGTTFTDALLVGTDLRGVYAKGATFHNAKLCGANLSASTLTNVDFTGADLTKANLQGSACKGADFTGATFCQTKRCNGTVDNSGCPSGSATICCADADCPASTPVCRNHQCVPLVCPGGGDPCVTVGNCIRPACTCATHIDGSGVCITGAQCLFCARDTDCPHPGTVCIKGASCCAGGTACAVICLP